jgi:hypothetical protein
MIITDLNGKIHKLNLSLYKSSRFGSSALHKEAIQILKELYPASLILEELPLKGLSPVLFLDIFIPSLMLGVEVNGKQHSEYTRFFHKDTTGFARAKANDKRKFKWLELNGIRLIVLDEDRRDEWKNQLESL